ncbi:tail tape measure protein [Paenibacillus oralis]|uniref:Tail tape measure protein n=2 Tax=Paenibacillus oralis TaxID=2490856 RepID=A0A3P3UCY9_9BACL|nr:tail tape measure protein [Paenibacillus oralis]
MKFIAATNRLRGVAGDQRAAQEKIAELQEKILQLQKQINSANRQSGQSSAGWLSNMRGLVATYLSIQGAQKVASISDEYINSQARLNMINDGLQTTAELQEKIFAAAERSRGSYTDMVGVIGRMGILASDAFKSNDELVAFTELMQKSFRVGGSSTMEQQAGMYQLSQAMAAGKLQGDEFRSIMENAPMLAAAIADFTGKSKGELKEMSADGTITADIIKGAMFNAADDINKKFASMPLTFGDAMNQLRNKALQAFGPAIERISAMLNNPDMQNSISNIATAFAGAAEGAIKFLDAAAKVYNFVSSNWMWIEPIIWGVVGAIAAWTVAQWGLNIALISNPIGLIIMGIAAVIGLIIFLVKWTINLWNTNDKFVAAMIRGWNSILAFFDQIPIFFTKVGYGIADAFDWAYVESLKIMEKLVNGVIDDINELIKTLNNIPMVQIDALSHVQFAASAALEAEARKQSRKEDVAKMESDAAKKAEEREKKLQKYMEDRAAQRAKEQTDKDNKGKEDPYNFDKFKSAAPPNIDKIGKVGQVDKIKDKVDISSEDLKMMRELAEMKSIQNFVTYTPTVSVSTGPVSKDVDVNEVVARIEQTLTEDLAANAAGVYA